MYGWWTCSPVRCFPSAYKTIVFEHQTLHEKFDVLGNMTTIITQSDYSFESSSR
jgi:hypothetical protein